MLIVRRSAVPFALAALVFSFSIATARAQMAGAMGGGQMDSQADSGSQPDDASAPAPAQPADTKASHAAAQTLVAKAKSTHAADTPLSPTERAQQMLNRFTFGPRPGEVQAVAALGAQKWFEQQLHPDQIGDKTLEKRIATEYPALALSPSAFLEQYPDRNMVLDAAEDKRPYPTDPIEAGIYETLVYRYNVTHDKKNAAGDNVPPPVLTDDQIAAQKAADKATAARVAGVLFGLPKQDRIMALMKMPVADRIAFADYVTGEQKRELNAEFSPREREIVYALGTNADASGVGAMELQQAKMVRAILSERQLQEVMTDFWFNHFNVYIYKDSDKWYVPSYERDVIRPHALGKFRDLLLATAESPAMMVYLDNITSIGPDSIANGGNKPMSKRGKRGLNENYGREVMELHTIGVNGGYTQADIIELAKILTGWGVNHPEFGGDFVFNPRNHEPGVKHWLGQTVKEDGQNEGIHALETLAASPKCAHFISYLIAQRFVADEPPPALVDRMAKTYLASDGDISAVLRTLVQSPEFNSHRYYRNKVKTPMEFVASTFRSTATDPTNPGALVYNLQRMGMPLYAALPPTGYYITAEQWMNSAALVDRLNYAVSLTKNGVGGMKFDAPALLALGLAAQPAGVRQGSGEDQELSVLENVLLGADVSGRTNQFLREQAGQPQKNPIDKLNQLTALIMGSPEFQMR